MEIKRDRYLKRLISKRNNGLIKVITGIRRCGKSYLLFRLYYNYLISEGVARENIITIPLDDADYAGYRDPLALHEHIKSVAADQSQQYYVFIDEAQFAITKAEMKNPDEPLRLYGVLNSWLRKGNIDVYITGSNSKFLSSDRCHSQSSIQHQGKLKLKHGMNTSTTEDFPTYCLNMMMSQKAYTLSG